MALFAKSKKIEGELGFFGLQDWWLNGFTAEERKTILSVYQPLGSSSDSLIKGKIEFTSQNVISFLWGLAGWFKKPELRHIGYKIIQKAEELANDNTPILDRHFLYQVKIELYYRNRDNDSFALSKAVEACSQQVSISEGAKKAFIQEYGQPLPSHAGYKQLCIIKEKQQSYEEAIRVAEMARMQGWNGDWDKRIERYKKKISKTT